MAGEIKVKTKDSIKESKIEGTEAGEFDRGIITAFRAMQEETKKELSVELKKEISFRASNIAEKIKSDLQNYVSQNQTRIVEALAIFVALFTFISINIQIFTKTSDLRSATIFMILMAFLSMVMISFPIILLRANKGDEKPKWVWAIFGTAVILFIVTLIISGWINIPLNIIEKK